MSSAQSFGFNASAVAFGGLVTTPTRDGNGHRPIKAAPSVALAPSGGDALSELKGDYKGEKGIAFHNSYTRVTGSVDGDIYETVVRVGLKGLDIFGRVRARSMAAVLISRHDTKSGDSSFTIEADIRGLEIAGDGVKAPLDFDLFTKVPTYKDFVAFFSKPKNMDVYAPKFGWNDPGGSSPAAMMAAFTSGAPLASIEPIRCSLLTERIDDGAPFRQEGYSLILPDGGTVHIAEVLVKPGRRRLNMLRVELPKPTPRNSRKAQRSTTTRAGAADEAGVLSGDTYNATVCSGEGNGSQSFP